MKDKTTTHYINSCWRKIERNLSYIPKLFLFLCLIWVSILVASSGMMPAYNFRPKILAFWSSLNAPRKSCKKINKCFKLDSPDFTAQTDYFKLYPIKGIHNHPKQFYVSIKQEITSTLKLLSLTCYAFFKHQTKRPEWASEGIELIRG